MIKSFIMDISDHIKGILDTLPDKPGCYIMKDKADVIIYVGKAISLKNRVRSYFHASTDLQPKTRQLVKHIETLEWIVVGSELEALILEMNLIKKHRPKYNIRLKDDRRYPYIKVHWNQDFPKITVTRYMEEDGSRYFGPYTSVWAVHQTLDVLRRIFPYLSCDREITGTDSRACLYHDIKLCTAPCIGAINKEDYRSMIHDLCVFLDGETDSIITNLTAQMQAASEQLLYERAAALRDRIQAVDRVVEKQKVISSEKINSDVIAMARENGEACVQIFFIRAGKLIGREYFILEGTEDEEESQIISQFMKQFYTEAASIPSQVLLPNHIEEAQVISEWLKTKRNCQKVELKVPRRGENAALIKMASENAVETLSALRTQWQADKDKQRQALAEITEALHLPEIPYRIECYDISNTQGTSAVGSMVVFQQGIPHKKDYRRFNIKTVQGPDDFASMEEVLRRRFKRWESYHAQEDVLKKKDESFSVLPDLIIVDGGKGQLSRAVSVLEEFKLMDKVAVAGLAKQQEELFVPGKSLSILLARKSQGLYLVQRIRDEAHRFAITAHRNQRGKIGLVSRMEAIPGIGPSRRKKLLAYFGSIDKIQSASVEEIVKAVKMPTELARSLKEFLE
jgi:excinuclease ABC subunit C